MAPTISELFSLLEPGRQRYSCLSQAQTTNPSASALQYHRESQTSGQNWTSTLTWKPENICSWHSQFFWWHVKVEICTVPHHKKLTPEVLKHGSHNFYTENTPCPPSSCKHSSDDAITDSNSSHLIAAHYSFIDPKRIQGRPTADSLPNTHIIVCICIRKVQRL